MAGLAREHRRLKWIARIMLGLAGIIYLFVIPWYMESLYLAAFGESAEGEVVRLASNERRPGDEFSLARYPVVRFRTARGEFEIRGRVGSSPPAHRVGDRVIVRFLADRPQHARIWNVWYSALIPVLSGIGALIPLGVGLYSRKVARMAFVDPPACPECLGRTLQLIALEPIKFKCRSCGLVHRTKYYAP